MSHSIKLADEVYAQLRQFQETRETYSDVVARLCRCAATILSVKSVLGPAHYLAQRPTKESEL